MKTIINKLITGQNLHKTEAEEATRKIMSGQTNDIEIAALLTALKMKGETAEEIAAFAKIMKEHATKITPNTSQTLVDMCGTGADNHNTFNISTTAMFIVAGTGIPIAKHGNRAITSKCGSADVLEELGVNLNTNTEKIKKTIEEIGIGFMFAPQHHTATKHVNPTRKALGFKTIFNILGPLTNPANAKAQLIGVYDPNLTEKIAEAQKILGAEKTMVVHGEPGIDELSNCGKNKITELKEGKINTYYITPEQLGLRRRRIEDLRGGTPKENAETIKKILSGEERGAKREAALLNAAAGIIVGGKKDNFEEALKEAENSLDSGAAEKKLIQLIKYCGK